MPRQRKVPARFRGKRDGSSKIIILLYIKIWTKILNKLHALVYVFFIDKLSKSFFCSIFLEALKGKLKLTAKPIFILNAALKSWSIMTDE